MTTLRIDVDGQTVFDAEVEGVSVSVDRDLGQVVSDPAMAAALAGAPAEAIAKMPGRMVAYVDHGSDVELTFRWRKPGSGVVHTLPEDRT